MKPAVRVLVVPGSRRVKREAEVTIGLAARTLSLPDGHALEFPIDPFTQRCLLEGVDELG